MSRTSDDSPAISLFSFQDIITSLTGIMFLVILLLVLCMIDMKKSDTQSSVKKYISAAQVREITEQINKLQKQEEQIRMRINELEKIDLDSLWIQLEILRKKTEQEKQKLHLEKLELEKLKDRLQNLQLTYNKLKEQKQKYYNENMLSAKQIAAKKDELQKKHAQTEKIKNALKFTIENTTSLTPVLVECTKNGVRIMECSTGTETDLRIPNGDFNACRQKFLDWVQQRGNDEYYTILVKPESFEYEMLISDLGDKGKSRGLELLPDNKISLFGGE